MQITRRNESARPTKRFSTFRRQNLCRVEVCLSGTNRVFNNCSKGLKSGRGNIVLYLNWTWVATFDRERVDPKNIECLAAPNFKSAPVSVLLEEDKCRFKRKKVALLLLES